MDLLDLDVPAWPWTDAVPAATVAPAPDVVVVGVVVVALVLTVAVIGPRAPPSPPPPPRPRPRSRTREHKDAPSAHTRRRRAARHGGSSRRDHLRVSNVEGAAPRASPLSSPAVAAAPERQRRRERQRRDAGTRTRQAASRDRRGSVGGSSSSESSSGVVVMARWWWRWPDSSDEGGRSDERDEDEDEGDSSSAGEAGDAGITRAEAVRARAGGRARMEDGKQVGAGGESACGARSRATGAAGGRVGGAVVHRSPAAAPALAPASAARPPPTAAPASPPPPTPPRAPTRPRRAARTPSPPTPTLLPPTTAPDPPRHRQPRQQQQQQARSACSTSTANARDPADSDNSSSASTLSDASTPTPASPTSCSRRRDHATTDHIHAQAPDSLAAPADDDMYPHHHHRGPPSPPGSVAGSLASSVGPAQHHHHHQQRAFSHQYSHQPHPFQPHLQQFHQHARPHPPPPPPPSSRPHSSPQQQQHQHQRQHQRDAPVPHAVLPILGTTQSGKSTLVQFLHDYCGMRPNDPSTLQIGNGVNSMTKASRCYSLRVPRRTALLVPVPDPVSPQLGHTSPMGSGISSIPSLASRTPSISSSTSTAPPHAQLAANAISPMGAALDPAEDAYLSNLLQSAHAVLDDDKDPWSIDESEIPPSSPAMSWFDPHEHGLPSPRPTPSPTPPSMQGPPSIRSGYNGTVPTAPMSNMMMPPPPPQVRQVALHPPSEPRTLYQLLSDLHDATFAGFTNSAPTRAQRAEYLERVEDLLHARTLRLDVTPIPHQAAPRMLLDVIDTPGLLDQASFHDPMVDLDHLVGLLDTVRRTGHAVTALVYVIGGDRPYDAAALRALATYLHNARDLSPHLIVVHSNYQVHRALARAKTRMRPSPTDQADDDDVPAFCLFDLGPRVAEFNRLLANLGFPDVHAVHVAMDNLPAGPLQRAGLQAVCYEGMHAFLDVVEQLASRAPPATPVARVHLVKPSILKELDAAFVGPAAQQRVELARHAVAALQRGPADLERKLVAAAERVAEVRAELAKVDAELARLDVDDVVDIATRVAVPVAECTCHGVRASSMSLAEWVRDQQRRAAAHAAGGSARHAPGCPAGHPSTSSRSSRSSSSSRRHASSSTATSRVVLDLESTVAIRDVHVVATSPRARLLDAQITRDKRRYRLVGTVPPDGAIVAKFFASRRDVYASVIAALKGARGALAARLARAQKRLETVLVAVGHDRRRVADAEGALARAWRVASAVGADRVPLDTYMGVHDEYRALAAAAMAKAGAGQQQQGYHGTDPDAVAARIVDRMLHGMLVADLAAGNLGGVEAGVPAP